MDSENKKQLEQVTHERARRLLETAMKPHNRRLTVLKEALEKLDASVIQIEDIDGMTGAEFEEFVAALFSGPDRTVEATQLTGDQGGDVIVSRGSLREVIQAKRSIGAISNSAIQEVVAAKAIYGCQSAWVITNASFTSGAELLAEANAVELVSRERLRFFLESGQVPTSRK